MLDVSNQRSNLWYLSLKPSFKPHLQQDHNTCMSKMPDLDICEFMCFHQENLHVLVETVTVSNVSTGWHILTWWIMAREPNALPHHWRKRRKRLRTSRTRIDPLSHHLWSSSPREWMAMDKGSATATTSYMPRSVRQPSGPSPTTTDTGPEHAPTAPTQLPHWWGALPPNYRLRPVWAMPIRAYTVPRGRKSPYHNVG